MQPRFLFDDKLHCVQNGVYNKTKIVTGTTLTLTDADNGTIISNLVSSGVLEITFPAPHIDLRFKVIVAAAQVITLTPASASQFVVPGSAAASTLALPAEIGVCAEIIGLSTGKFAIIVTDEAGGVVLADAANIAVGTTTGTKIGTATSQKLGFWNATPVIQQASGDQAAVGAATTVGSNTGTAGSGLSLIGSTSGGDVSGAIMNDFKALQEDIVALTTLVNRMRLDLVTTGIIKGSA